MKSLKPKELKAINDNEPDDNENFLKYKENFDEIFNERLIEIFSISKQIDFNNRAYKFKEKNYK